MIKIDRLEQSLPYKRFYNLYDNCLKNNQKIPQAIFISSFDVGTNEVDARLVNLKYVLGDEWIFFTNYNSPKSLQIDNHKQISAVLYWQSIDTQIRFKAYAKKTSGTFSDYHFNLRSNAKNALAVSSDQSMPIESYKKVKDNFNELMLNKENYQQRPSYWGGYSFTPYIIEFWEGHESRLNNRIKFTKKNDSWQSVILQP